MGPLLAAELGLPFFDTDREIERVAGMPAHRIFVERGEPEFRRLEAEAVTRVLTGPPTVVALGGGALLDESTRRLVLDKAVTVWLRAEPAELASRLAGSSEVRPLLQGADPAARLAELLAHREQHYSLAQLTIDTTGRSPGEVAATLARSLRDTGLRR